MSRAIYGDGTLTKRKDGRWEFRIRVGERPNGDPNYKSFYSRKSDRDAKKKYRDWMATRPEDVIGSVKTVGQWAEIWLETYKKGKCGAENYKNYKMYVEKHIIPHIGAMRLDSVRQVHIEQLYSAESKLSASALNYVKISLKGIFNSGMKNHLCRENPAANVKPPKKAKTPPVYFTKAEVARILSFAEEDSGGVYALALLYTGLRIGEICALMWSDFDGESISVSKGVARDSEHGKKFSMKFSTKSERDRTVVLDPAGAAFFNSLPKKGLYIFPGQRNAYSSPDTYRKRYYRFLDALNASCAAGEAVRRLSPHKCRHTYGTFLLDGCKNLRTVQEQLGHSRVSTTELYTHTDVGSRKADVKMLKY